LRAIFSRQNFALCFGFVPWIGQPCQTCPPQAETAIDEHRQFLFWKNEIWFARELRTPRPAGDAVRMSAMSRRSFLRDNLCFTSTGFIGSP
jgi:hypothetical protein